MWSGITWEQKEALLELSDVGRRSASPIGEAACLELHARGLIAKAADGSWYLSRSGWELLLPA
jgi:hypothetical protein